MAEITRSVLGHISGHLGNLVFRRMNGNRFISVRPSKYKAGKSASAKEGRTNFAITIALAKSVNCVSVLKQIWAASDAEGTNSFQKLIKNNAKLVKEGSLSTSNKITPKGLNLVLTSAVIENNKLHLSLLCSASQYLKFPAVLFIYFYFHKEGKTIVPLVVPIEAAESNDNYEMDLTLDNRIMKMISQDSHPIIYIALVGGTTYKRKVYWTSTKSLQM